MKRPMVSAALLAVVLSLTVVNTAVFTDILIAIAVILILILSAVFKRFRFCVATFSVAFLILLNSVILKVGVIKKFENIDTETPITVSGTIISENYGKEKASFVLKTDSENTVLPAGVKLSVYTKFAALNTGDKVNLNVYLKAVPEEYKTQSYAKGVYGYATISKVLKIEHPVSLTSLLSDFRGSVTKMLYENMSSDSAASVNALTVGDKYYLSSDFEENVKRSGVSHVMVVSGMHMAIICGGFLKILRVLKLGNRLSAAITAVFVFFFMALCGFSMSVMRAGITYFIILLATFLVRRTDAFNSLCVAVCFIIMLNPFSGNSVAFQLSCMSTAGIIILSTPIANKINRIFRVSRSALKAITEMVSVTLSALIFTIPLTVYYFGGISTVALITNLLIGLAVTAALYMAALAIPIEFVFGSNYLTRGLFFFCDMLTRYFSTVINGFGEKYWSYIEVNRTVTIICYLAIILSFVIIKYVDYILKVVKDCANSIRTAVKGKCQ